MPGQFTDKNGGNMAGHSDKWSNSNRRQNSYQAGQGSRGSRNQGTGMAGKAQTVASDEVDTSKMNPEEKLRYFNKLGLLNPTQKKQLADIDAAKEQTQQSQQQKQEEPKANPVNELVQKLQQTFGSKPELFQSIVQAFKAVPKDDLKDKAHSVLNIVKSSQGQSPAELYTKVIQKLEGAHEVPHTADVQSEPSIEKAADREELGKSQQRGKFESMTPEEFHRDYDYLGKNFVNELIKQASYFNDPEKALFHISLATDNVDNMDDDDEIRSSMASAADDLGSFFEPKGHDDIDFDDEDNSTESSEKPTLSQSEQHSYSQDKEAYEAPTLEQGLQKFRTPDERQMKDVDKFLSWLANKMKESGTDPKSINRTISHYRDIAKNNIYKFNKGRNAIADNAEAYDPEYGSEVEHYLNSMESTMEDYDRGEITPWEKQFEQLYNKLHGKK